MNESKKKKRNRKIKSFRQFYKPYYPLTGGMGISYYDNDQDTDMNTGISSEEEETFTKGEMCECEGDGCSNCNGRGFHPLK